jgi:hypothetical protein
LRRVTVVIVEGEMGRMMLLSWKGNRVNDIVREMKE